MDLVGSPLKARRSDVTWGWRGEACASYGGGGLSLTLGDARTACLLDKGDPRTLTLVEEGVCRGAGHHHLERSEDREAEEGGSSEVRSTRSRLCFAPSRPTPAAVLPALEVVCAGNSSCRVPRRSPGASPSLRRGHRGCAPAVHPPLSWPRSPTDGHLTDTAPGLSPALRAPLDEMFVSSTVGHLGTSHPSCCCSW